MSFNGCQEGKKQFQGKLLSADLLGASHFWTRALLSKSFEMYCSEQPFHPCVLRGRWSRVLE